MRKKDVGILIEDAIAFADSLNINGYEYVFSKSCTKPTLYSSVYACMIKGWNGRISKDEKANWSEYINSFQRPNGFYEDINCMNENYYKRDGWGARHLIPHVIIALRRLDAKPKFAFSFLERMKDPDNVIAFLEELDFQKIWGTSNIIMNYGVTMQYARDYMGEPFSDSLIAMEEWLIKRIKKDCAMWQEMPLESINTLYETIRGAYHIYPILLYDNIKIPYFERVIPYLLRSQNPYGGFDKNKYSSACDDIDAIDPLVRCSIEKGKQKNVKIRFALKRARRHVITNRNQDGGFVFSRNSSFTYGGASQLSSKSNESNLFGTWFRLLSLILIDTFFEKEVDNRLLFFPGYELCVSSRNK